MPANRYARQKCSVMERFWLLTWPLHCATIVHMETKTLTFNFRLTEDQMQKLRAIAAELRRKEADALRVIIEDKYSEISGVQSEQVPA